MEKYQQATKQHTCNWCRQTIHIGEVYRRSPIFFEGSAATWKSHQTCLDLALKLEMFQDNEPLTADDFQECVVEHFGDIMYKKDKSTYNSDHPMPEFLEVLNTVKDHYKI